MRWYDPIIWLVLCCLFVWGLNAADAATFKFKNSGCNKVVMTLFWIDHGLDHDAPYPVMCAELKKGANFDGSYDYPGKYFYVNASSKSCLELDDSIVRGRTIDVDGGHVLIVWDGEQILIE